MLNRCKRSLAVACISAALAPALSLAASHRKLVVHEWGTFTVLQDDNGRQLGGINVDDEPVPPFVHNLNRTILARPLSTALDYSKGLPPRHPFVTVRLETPVIYFYPPRGQTSPITLDVDVSLQGGWLTEFYPDAAVQAPGITPQTEDFRQVPITPATTGALSWKHLSIGTDLPAPSTDEPVWLTPRETAATSVATSRGEAEKYLFYRGVGNFDAPLSVRRQTESGPLEIRGNFQDALAGDERATVKSLWLVHIRSDGCSAFRRAAPFEVGSSPKDVVATITAEFAERDYEPHNVQKLKAEMLPALVAGGLFADEARALLDTWNRAYFQKPGLRVFFIVPRVWTDARMPLSISVPAEVQRVMVGRIELKSPEQRALLRHLARATISDPTWVRKLHNTPNARRFMKGDSDFGDLGVAIPPDYRLYLDLGRFRNALLMDESLRHPSEALDKFIAANRLRPIQPPATPSPNVGAAAAKTDSRQPSP